MLQFILTAPDNTQKAILATSYDNFAPHVATRIGGRRWRVTLDICGESSDSLRYYTVIDGVIVIPDCHLREPDGFGGFNCVYEFAKYSQESRYEHK